MARSLKKQRCCFPVGIASSGFPFPDFSGPEAFFPDSGNFNSRSGNREIDKIVILKYKSSLIFEKLLSFLGYEQGNIRSQQY